jgi:NAD(P)-dependent dehydrogenase (short-subunit alcohol dehydrogenase family)
VSSQRRAAVAIVTGAGSGIGRATSLGLLDAGYNVALVGRRRDALQETVRGYPAAPARSLPIASDIREPAAVRAVFDRVMSVWGRVDLLFNNAGVFGPGVALDELTDEQWQAVIDTNLTGAFLCAREAFRTMKAQRPQGGRIINNGSVSAHVPRPNAIAYTASKHAITGLTKAISLEGRAYDIACGQIDIGNAATDFIPDSGQAALQSDGSRRAEPSMDVRHAVNAVLHMAGLPLSANVQFLTVIATNMPYIGRG